MNNKKRTNLEYKQIADSILKKCEEKSKNCPICSCNAKKYSIKRPTTFRCSFKLRRHLFNILRNTPFEGKVEKIPEILEIYDCWLEGLNDKQISWVCRKDRKAVWKILKKMGEHLIHKFYERLEPIGGKNIVVEIDESKFGKVKYNRGHRVDGVWVLGMVEKTPERRIILVPVKDRKANTLIPLLKKYINSESDIHSDCFKSYTNLNQNFKNHQTVNHSLWFVDPVSGIHTNTIEGNWAAVKINTPIRKRTRKNITLNLIRYMLKRKYPVDILLHLINYFF